MHCMKVASLSYQLFAEVYLPLKTQHRKHEHRGSRTWIFFEVIKCKVFHFRPAIIIPFQFYNLGNVQDFVFLCVCVCVDLNLCVCVYVDFIFFCVCLCVCVFASFCEVCCILFGPYYSSWSLTWAIPVLAQRTWPPGPCNVCQASSSRDTLGGSLKGHKCQALAT